MGWWAVLLCGISAVGGELVVEVQPFGRDSLHVIVGERPRQLPVQGLLPDPPSLGGGPPVRLGAGGNLVNGNLKVQTEASGYLTFTRVSDGEVLLREIARTVAGNQTLLRFEGREDEALYGMGQHRTGNVTMKPFFQRFQDSEDVAVYHDEDICIPYVTSTRGWGFLWNAPSFGHVNLTDTALEWTSNLCDQLDYWVTTTPAELNTTDSPFPSLLHRYVDATGHAPPLPFWATGFWQSKNRYRNQTQLLDIARGYLERDLPLSVIVIDWFHWNHLGDWSFNNACWPDPTGMVKELEVQGVRVMVSVWPFVESGSVNFAEMAKLGYLVTGLDGKVIPVDHGNFLYDSFNPKAREYVFQKITDGYIKHGITTFWLDACEPEQFNIQPGKLVYAAGLDSAVGMAFAQQHERMVFDGMTSLGHPVGSFLTLARHSWSGYQRYSTAIWSGDITGIFSELAMQVRVAQMAAMSGIPWWTTDIGGYIGENPEDPTYRELIVRWFQFGAFCPLFRLHGVRKGGPPANSCGDTNGDNELWAYGEEAVAAVRPIMELREQLRDYIVRHLQDTADTGMPLIRPMIVAFPNDKTCRGAEVEAQYMFGPDWLVAPVFEEGAKNRRVYLPPLPEGEEWVYHFTQTAVKSTGWQVVDTPLAEFPLFCRRPV